MIHGTVFIEDELHDEIDGSSLPEPLKAATKSIPIAESVVRIGDKYKLLIREIDGVYDEAKKVLLGESSAKDFPNALKEAIDSDRHEAIPNIVKEINNEIFLKIRSKVQGNSPVPSSGSPITTETAKIQDKFPEQIRKTAYGQMGTFTPRKSPVPASALQTATPPIPKPSETLAIETLDRGAILNEIENPVRIPPTPERTLEKRQPLPPPPRKPLNISNPISIPTIRPETPPETAPLIKPLSQQDSNKEPPTASVIKESAPPSPAPAKIDPYREPTG